MDITVNELDIEIERLTKSNDDISNKMSSTPFFREWDIMCKEAEGSKHSFKRLKEELQKKKTELESFNKKLVWDNLKSVWNAIQTFDAYFFLLLSPLLSLSVFMKT